MNKPRKSGALVIAVIALLGAGKLKAQSTSALNWPRITRDARPWTRWWWMGSAVDSAGITGELKALSAAGFGGVEVTSIYGVRGAESKFVSYLSPRWVALLGHASTQAHRLGMGVDIPPGSGWRMGGPRVPPADANASLRIVIDSSRRGETTYTAVVRNSGDDVKRPAPGGEGMAIDVLSRAATERYLQDFAAHTRELPRGAVGSYFHDSFEYTGNASPELFDFFSARRGYDLRSELRALAGRGDTDHVARVKSDYRQTLDEMLLENFMQPLSAWAHRRGSLMRQQAHGSPGNILDFYASSDIPETEIFGPLGGPDANPLINKFASSAAHLQGRPLASAESFTWLGEHFSATLNDVRQAADQLFLAGINHLVYHGTAYSPHDAAWPGWLFYASAEFNSRNALWRDLPTLNRYVTRVQSVLQAGHSDNDVLLYWPVWDSWHDAAGLRMDMRVHTPTWLVNKPVGAIAEILWSKGFAFDYVSDRLLASRVQVQGAHLRAGTATYATIVVPSSEHMPPETLHRLIALARAGATVLFVERLPHDVPGLSSLAERRAALEVAKSSISFGASDGSGIGRAVVGRGRIMVGGTVESLLAAAGVHRDAIADHPGLRFVRQRRANGHQYFVAHAGATMLDEWIALPLGSVSAAIMDPMTGRIGLARVRQRGNGREVRLELEPGSSVILRVFDTSASGSPWTYFHNAQPALALRGTWSVEFIDGGPVLPQSFRSDSLVPFTQRGDDDADRFAGTARYTLTFDAPDGARAHVLDLGRVAESARVRLNGKELGTRVAHPFTLLAGPLRHRGNVLEIDVTNLSANRIRDLDRRAVPWRVFNDINYVGIDYKPFDASAWPVRPSGLLGPVTLRVVAPN